MLKYILIALAVFVASGFWLSMALAEGYATNSWTETPAVVGRAAGNRGFGKRSTSIETPVTYSFDGKDFEGAIREFLIPGKGTVFVNPDDPTQVVGFQGPAKSKIPAPKIQARRASKWFLRPKNTSPQRQQVVPPHDPKLPPATHNNAPSNHSLSLPDSHSHFYCGHRFGVFLPRFLAASLIVSALPAKKQPRS